MGSIARRLTLSTWRAEDRIREWQVLNEDTRRTVATVLKTHRSDWSTPIHLGPDEQENLRAHLPKAETLRGLGTLWTQENNQPFFGRVDCRQLKPNDRILRATWKNAFSDPRSCVKNTCSHVLRQAIRNAQNEDVTVRLKVLRALPIGDTETHSATCRIKRRRSR